MSPIRLTLGDLSKLCGGRLVRGDPGVAVGGVGTLSGAEPDDVAFYSNPSYRKQLDACRAAAIIASESDARLPELAERPVLVADNPYAAFAKIATAFHPRAAPVAGVDPAARVDVRAEVDPSARVEAFALVGPGAHIGARTVIMAGAYVGAGASVGADSLLYPHAVVREGCIVGARCTLHSCAVVGADGFGFAFDPEGDGEGPIHRKIPQTGIVRVEDDVEIGANSCVDRATMGETVIGHGTKIDNLVQIAHNVQIGPLCVIASQTGIAGSTTVGTGVSMGGQTGIVGHVHIGDMARLGASTGIRQDVAPGETLVGQPALEYRRFLRVNSLIGRLPEMVRDLRQLAGRLAAVERKIEMSGTPVAPEKP